MGNLVLAFSMSLDGLVAGADIGMDNPMGNGGEQLHAWMGSGDPVDAEALRAQHDRPGAVILGRTTYDVGRRHWDGTPYPVPSFVLTHQDAAPDPGFAFVRTGIGDALAEASKAAAGRDIVVMGATVARQYLAAGLVDELALQIVPILLGSGARLFDEGPATALQMTEARASPNAIHATYRPGTSRST
ncbi:MAG: dihydrofolate reductase family protein [Pseudomonadota bacterium]|nr:dihydrofolate reductase family protein [Pseudomonadota bacterium]